MASVNVVLAAMVPPKLIADATKGASRQVKKKVSKKIFLMV